MKKKIILGLASLVLVFGLMGNVGAATPVYVDDDNCPGPGSGTSADPYCTIADGITNIDAGGTVYVADGTYNEGITIIGKDLTIIGDVSNKPIIIPTTNTGLDNVVGSNGRGWFQITGADVIFQNLVFDGTGKNIRTAVHYHGDSTGGIVENCDFRDIRHASQYHGRGINNYGQQVAVTDCTFENIQRIGVFTFNPDAETLISGCTYTGKSAGDFLDYGFEAGNGANIIIEDSTVTDCIGVADSDGSISAGILVTTAWGSGTTATITANNILDSTIGIAVGYGNSDTSVVTANYNNIVGNDTGVSSTAPQVDAENNWWGHASGPSGDEGRTNKTSKVIGKGDAVSANVDWNPWLPQPVGHTPNHLVPPGLPKHNYLPENAEEIALGVFYLGESMNKGKVIEGYAFVHYTKDSDKAKKAKPVWDESVDMYKLMFGGIKWAETMTYEVNTTDSDLDHGTVMTVLSNSLETWDDAITGDFKLFDTIGISDKTSVEYDGTNLVMWDDLGSDGTIAVNYFWFYRATKEMVQSDVVFNTYYDWNVDDECSGNMMDLQSIATHEFGHNGLNDLYMPKSIAMTMHGYSYGYCETHKRDLGAGDISGIQKLYGNQILP